MPPANAKAKGRIAVETVTAKYPNSVPITSTTPVIIAIINLEFYHPLYITPLFIYSYIYY